MKLFTLGPVEMFPETLEVSSKQIPYFRTPEFSQIVLECEEMLKEFAGIDKDGRAVFLTCSGTGAMEAAVINCFTEEDRVLVVDGGGFGHRFVELCELHHIPHEAVKLGYDEALTDEHLRAYDGQGFTGFLVNIDETSTGQLYPIDVISDFCSRNGATLIVDAISSFLVDPYNAAEYGIDATIMSSQKALALAPGLSVVLLSSRIIKERVERIDSGCMYLDFKDHLINGVRGQTPFTPAVGIVYQLHERLCSVRERGLENVLADVDLVVKDFRRRATQLSGISLPDYPVSNACTPLIFDNGRAFEVYEALKNEYGLVVTPSGGDLKGRIIRVGHLGNHTIEDNVQLVEAMKEVLER